MLWTAQDVARYGDQLQGTTWQKNADQVRWTWLAGRRFRNIRQL